MKKLLLIVILATLIGSLAWRLLPDGEPLPPGSPIDRIVVLKSQRIMQAFSGDKILKTYKISLGINPVGDKETEGDKRTPEGNYFINGKNSGSGYHKNLGISYPNANDIAEAKAKGVGSGGDIKIHGIRNGVGFIGKFHRLFDWTAGCIAVTDEEVDELYANVKVGTPVIIRP
jgi:murein L,D-transpeptidase YafK